MRFIVLGIEDNEAAQRVTESFQHNGTFRFEDGLVVDTAVVGLFAVPTQYCNPSDGHRGKKTEAGWTRGKKYGWWVCGACKKPTEAWAKNLNAVLSAARNLLNEGKDILGAAQTARKVSE